MVKFIIKEQNKCFYIILNNEVIWRQKIIVIPGKKKYKPVSWRAVYFLYTLFWCYRLGLIPSLNSLKKSKFIIPYVNMNNKKI